MAWTNTFRGRVLNRSYRLHDDGYKAVEVVAGVFEVRKGAEVRCAVIDGIGNCPCAKRAGYCKHSEGLNLLLRKQREEEAQEAYAEKFRRRAEARRFAAMAGAARERKAAA